VVLLNCDVFRQMKRGTNMVMSWPYPESNVLALSRVATSANPRQPPMNRSVTLPADGGGVRLAPVEWKRPRRHRAVARALVVQRRSLVWPVTSSARRGSFLARPGTCRAGPAASLGVPEPPVGCSLCHRSFVAFASLMPAAAADPCATLQGGLDREAAVGRRRRECG
jgi:hypothetical protein